MTTYTKLQQVTAGLLLVLGMNAGAQTAGGTPAAPATAVPAPSKYLAPGFAGLATSDKVLVMPVDVELFSLSAGGVAEPRADWTEAALRHTRAALQAHKAKLGLATIEGTEDLADEFAEQTGLFAAVARSIALHHGTGGIWALPTKAGQLLWNLGDAMQPLAQRTGARYGLFVWMRDSYASAERKAMMVGLALLGVGIGGGVQTGYAALVDLQSGQVVWFNQLLRASGDLREAVPATESIGALLIGFPQAR